VQTDVLTRKHRLRPAVPRHHVPYHRPTVTGRRAPTPVPSPSGASTPSLPSWPPCSRSWASTPTTGSTTPAASWSEGPTSGGQVAHCGW